MTRHDDQVSLNDMLKHAREAVAILGGMTKDELANDRLRQLALIHLVEIVGEAGNRVSKSTQENHPQIPWAEIIGMRNNLIHGYDIIDRNLLWDTIKSDIPHLIDQLEEIVKKG